MDGGRDAEALSGVPARPSPGWAQRVRRCRACGTDGPRAAFGLAIAVDDLRLAAPQGTGDDLDHALATVGASSWVRARPDGVDTVVGDGGRPLTAAHARHLALARLVLADRAVAVLDEATAEGGSAGARVDAAAAIAERTTVVVAHRLSQAATADRAVVVDGGRVQETGTHDEALVTAGRHAELWQSWAHVRAAHHGAARPSDEQRA